MCQLRLGANSFTAPPWGGRYFSQQRRKEQLRKGDDRGVREKFNQGKRGKKVFNMIWLGWVYFDSLYRSNPCSSEDESSCFLVTLGWWLERTQGQLRRILMCVASVDDNHVCTSALQFDALFGSCCLHKQWRQSSLKLLVENLVLGFVMLTRKARLTSKKLIIQGVYQSNFKVTMRNIQQGWSRWFSVRKDELKTQ